MRGIPRCFNVRQVRIIARDLRALNLDVYTLPSKINLCGFKNLKNKARNKKNPLLPQRQKGNHTDSGDKKLEKIKTSIKSYWNWRSRSFGHDADKSTAVADKWEAILQQTVTKAPGKRVLDIGTGTGQLAVYLARAGFEVTGVDIAENMVAQAGQYAASQNLDIRFRTGDAEHLDFEDNSFDAVVSRNLLWTLPHPENALKEWRRVLAPDGVLVLSDGFWMNTTWKRVHHLGVKLLNGIMKKGSLISLRFFYAYAKLQKHLPLYEGVSYENASLLMQAACFREIESKESLCRDFFPYGSKRIGGHPSFFIACARR